MKFFSQFPKVKLKIADERTETEYTDIFRHVDVNETLIDDISSYTYYQIEDGERPDTVSYKLYGRPEYHWSFFITNEHLKNGLREWPRSYREQESYIYEKYDQYSVLEFVPWSVKSNTYYNNGISALGLLGANNTDLSFENHFGSIPFKDSKYKLVDADSDFADIVSYDSNRLQIWVENLPDEDFISNDNKEYTLDYDFANIKERDEWLNSDIIPWLRDFKSGLYTLLINDERINNDNILPYTRGSVDPISADYFSGGTFQTYTFPLQLSGAVTPDTSNYWHIPDQTSPYDSPGTIIQGELGSVTETGYTIAQFTFPYTFPTILGGETTIPISWTPAAVTEFPNISLEDVLYEHYLPEIKFKTNRSWLKSYNAPHRYYDNEGNETDLLSFFDESELSMPHIDAGRPQSVIDFADYTDFIRYYDEEEAINLDRRNIRVIKSSDIEDFSDYYKELINA